MGLLCTLKGVYVGALVGVLVVFHRLMGDRGSLTKDGLRASTFLLSAAMIWLAYKGLVTFGFDKAQLQSVETQFESLKMYGSQLNYRLYPYVAHDMIPHGVVGLGLLGATAPALRARLAGSHEILAAWIILAVGVGVAWFHETCFAYFWMTIGLFPAAGAAVALGPIREAIAKDGTKLPLIALIHLSSWLLLSAQSVPTGLDVLKNTLRRQRDSMDFVERNFRRDSLGFHVEGALTCREPKNHFQVYFSPHIFHAFYGANAERNIIDFLDEFRDRPVEFIVRSPREIQFPTVIQDFWSDHYVHYKAGVLVPGFSLEPGSKEVEVLVAGEYRWRPAKEGSASLVLQNQEVAADGTVRLDQGMLTLEAPTKGVLHLKQKEAPESASPYFYSEGSMRELGTFRR
jgi:hypothetical protein